MEDYLVGAISNIEQLYQNVTIIHTDTCSESDIKGAMCTVLMSNIMNAPGYDIIYSYNYDGQLITEEEQGILVNNTIYSMTYSAPFASFSDYGDIFNMMINNFVLNLNLPATDLSSTSRIDNHDPESFGYI